MSHSEIENLFNGSHIDETIIRICSKLTMRITENHLNKPSLLRAHALYFHSIVIAEIGHCKKQCNCGLSNHRQFPAK